MVINKNKKRRLVLVVIFLTSFWLLPFFVLAQCVQDDAAWVDKSCSEIVCCGGSTSQCTQKTEMDIGSNGAVSYYTYAKCVPLRKTEQGNTCYSEGVYPDKKCSEILCCSGLKCSSTSVAAGLMASSTSAAQCDKDEKQISEVSQPPTVFTPSVTIPGSIFTAGKELHITGDTLAQYLKAFYGFFVGFMVVVAVVMIMWGGFKRIMAAGSAENIKNANGTIFAAIIGLVITLISYTLLNLINPALVSFQPLTITPIKKETINFISSADYEVLTKSKPIKAFGADMIAKMQQTAKASGIDYCVIWTIFQKESGGRVDAIGYDENVNNEIANNVPSRKRFVERDNCVQFISKKKADDCESGTRGKAKNDDSSKNVDVKKDNLGLDWRYSRGFGVSQITIFPDWHSNYKNCNGTPCINIGGKDYLPKDLFDLDKNLEAMSNLWKSKCRGDATVDCFKKYNGSTDYGIDAIKIYNSCKRDNP